MSEQSLFGCPICNFTDKDHDVVSDHILDVHEDEVYGDARPVNLGLIDEENGECYTRVFKKIKKRKSEEEEVVLSSHTNSNRQIEQLKEQIVELQTTVSELSKDNHYLHNELSSVLETVRFLKEELGNQHGQTQQRVKVLESYLSAKENNHRRDFDLLAIDLKNEVLKRGKKGLDYKEVMLIFRFKSPQEAYRLMDIAAKAFYDELRLYKPKNQKQTRKLVSWNRNE